MLVGAIAALALGELFLRAARPPRLSVIRYPCIYRPDETLGFRYVPNSRGVVAGHFEIHNEVEINSLGFWDSEPLPPGRSELRILAVGDSFTAAMNVKRSEVWTSVLENELRRRGWPGADVVNAGIDGTGTDVHLQLIREYAPRFAAHVVILAFYANDIGDVIHGRFQRECYRKYVLSYQTLAQRDAMRVRIDSHHEKKLRRWLFDHFYLIRLLNVAIDEPLNPYRIQFLQPRLAELGIDARVRQARGARLGAVFRELVRFSESCNCRLLVVPVPPAADAKGSLDLWRRNARTTALEVLDVVPALEQIRRRDGREHSDLYFENDNHFNAYGNALYARAIADFLEGSLPDLAPE
jgi:lysophospholipase L1-like esterase